MAATSGARARSWRDRLVEAGVRFVTLTFSGWDFHSSLESGMKRVLPLIDSAIGTLIEDLRRPRAAGFDDRAGDGRIRPDAAAEHDRRAGGRPGARARSLGQRHERAGRRRRTGPRPGRRRVEREGRDSQRPAGPPAGLAGHGLSPARHRPRRPASPTARAGRSRSARTAR